MENNFDELITSISNIMGNTQRTPQETGRGLRRFGQILEEFSQLSDKEKAEFWIEAFSDRNNKDACEAFANRHPDCSLNVFIPKD